MPKGRGKGRRRKARPRRSPRREQRRNPLVSLADDAWLFHGTSMDVAWSAAEEGLKPGVEGCVFVTPARDLAECYAQTSGVTSDSGVGVLLKIRRSSLPDLKPTAEPRWTYPGFVRDCGPNGLGRA